MLQRVLAGCCAEVERRWLNALVQQEKNAFNGWAAELWANYGTIEQLGWRLVLI
jgi:hypothetical protein